MANQLKQLLATAMERPLTAEELNTFNSLNQDGGFDALIGTYYTHIAHGEVRGAIDIEPRHHQPWGIANGGVYCTLAESVASLAGIIASGGKALVGINNDTNFIRSASDGTVEATARPLQLGRRTQIWEIEMTQGDKLLAKTTLRTMVLE
ncbi:PaaI family thioesterase [uncultured Corynebacterium sp.]|uniref:PaaI family thioesterase n=1 Tax=uncultured Corynebacterium sp. TaxID=159447 RepID=UPI0025ECF161|nr:PaaI family thioesterase [uncultured Corynebacterium sp.]